MSITALTIIEKEVKSNKFAVAISNSLGKQISDPGVMKFINGAMMYITASNGTKSDITTCTPQSIIDSLIEAATVRLPVDKRHLASLVPYGRSCTFMPEWRGYVYKVKEADPTADFTVGVVYKGDTFTCGGEDGNATYKHIVANPFEDSPENIIGIYCYIKTSTGSYIEKMSKKELDKVKGQSKMKSGFIWNTWELEMHKKSIVRRACKLKFTEAIAELDAADNKLFIDRPVAEPVKIAESAPLPKEKVEEAVIVDDKPVENEPTDEPTPEELQAKAEEAKRKKAELEAIEAAKAPKKATEAPKEDSEGFAPIPVGKLLKGAITAYYEPNGRGPHNFIVDGTKCQTFDVELAETLKGHKDKGTSVELECHISQSANKTTGKVYENVVIDRIAVQADW